MGSAIRGAFDVGSVLTYQVPRGFDMRLELLAFTIATDGTAGIHKARLRFIDTTVSRTTATLRDLNEAGPLETVHYTYGIGLNGSACVAADGWDVTDALPDTLLAHDTEIHIDAVDDAGNVIAGDAISAVTLFGDLLPVGSASSAAVDLSGVLLPG